MLDLNKIPAQGWKLDKVLPWGKYEGATIREVGEIDISYLEWLSHLDGILLHPEVLEMLPMNDKWVENEYNDLPF